MRFCAYCLESSTADSTLLTCGGCHRRTFCSKECQRSDWSSKTTGTVGQDHKNWCAHLSGEEGLDWEVRQTESKGLGLFAMRTLPAGFRIMVDRALTLDEVVTGGRTSLAPGAQIILEGLTGISLAKKSMATLDCYAFLKCNCES